MVIPIVVGALETIPKGLKKRLKKLVGVWFGFMAYQPV